MTKHESYTRQVARTLGFEIVFSRLKGADMKIPPKAPNQPVYEVHAAPMVLYLPSQTGKMVGMSVPYDGVSRSEARKVRHALSTVPRETVNKLNRKVEYLHTVGAGDQEQLDKLHEAIGEMSNHWPYKLHTAGYKPRRARRLLAKAVGRSFARSTIEVFQRQGLMGVFDMPMVAAFGDRARRIVHGGAIGGGFWRYTPKPTDSGFSRAAARFKKRTGRDPYLSRREQQELARKPARSMKGHNGGV